jgi:hypothetical protein
VGGEGGRSVSNTVAYAKMIQPGYVMSGAVISDCLTYRYRLWRRWSEGSRVVFVMLNPSTASAAVDDPTIRKCVGFAKRYGYGALEVVNLFAYRATDPADLRQAGFLIGPENDDHIRAACSETTQAICAWGANVDTDVARHRAQHVHELLTSLAMQPMALGFTKSGQPSHPLMLPYDRPLQPWAVR